MLTSVSIIISIHIHTSFKVCIYINIIIQIYIDTSFKVCIHIYAYSYLNLYPYRLRYIFLDTAILGSRALSRPSLRRLPGWSQSRPDGCAATVLMEGSPVGFHIYMNMYIYIYTGIRVYVYVCLYVCKVLEITLVSARFLARITFVWGSGSIASRLDLKDPAFTPLGATSIVACGIPRPPTCRCACAWGFSGCSRLGSPLRPQHMSTSRARRCNVADLNPRVLLSDYLFMPPDTFAAWLHLNYHAGG